MAFWLLLLMLTACAAMPTDLSGKMFIFPEETNTANVKLIPALSRLTAITVCLRFKTDLRRNHALFSLATATHHNAFLIFKDSSGDDIDVYVGNANKEFEGQDYKLNTWHSICTTWDAASGLVQLWLDGKSTIKKYFGGPAIVNPIIILGQEQDSHGGRFDRSQSFLGMICDVHVWNYVLSPCEIMRFMNDENYTPGNVVNWSALTSMTTGRVLTEDKQKACEEHKQCPGVLY
ncbi:serum amyloid P-component-like [Sebastes fasciatus]|uniref:serum amyloid P-component-like n=1 Tax=Sebastes fasciatus TaxID=394691 RepID=UPI003D9F23C8